MDFSSLDDHFVNKDKVGKPTEIEFIYYLFFDRGITLKEFNELPIPYIFSVISTFNYVKKEEEKAMKKARKK